MAYACATPEDVLKAIKDDEIVMVDLRFTDLPGLWQHFSIPPMALDVEGFTEGSASTAQKSGESLPVSHINSTLRPASRSNLRLEHS